LLTAIEMLEDHPLLRIDHEVRLPLLTPFNSSTPEEEVERRLEEGFRTFKIKVGTMRMRISSVSGLSSGPSPVAQLCE
jgi:hypothetical protein